MILPGLIFDCDTPTRQLFSKMNFWWDSRGRALFLITMEKANLLPSGWKVYYDEQRSRVYYVNLFTKDTQWTRPLPPETHNIIDIKRILVANNLPILFFFFVSLFFIYAWNDQAYKPADYTGQTNQIFTLKRLMIEGCRKKLPLFC